MRTELTREMQQVVWRNRVSDWLERERARCCLILALQHTLYSHFLERAVVEVYKNLILENIKTINFDSSHSERLIPNVQIPQYLRSAFVLSHWILNH